MAGMRTAGFVLVATFFRPVGGILGDKIGGKTILTFVFPFTAVMALFLACPTMPIFTLGALGMAVAIGLGNGAVFKLVPEYFPTTVGSVTGVVGAAGGLGGFFPPLLLGAIKQQTGSFTLGFVALSIFSISCLVVLLLSQRNKAMVPVTA
jgi:NNP family nitrate/nitrite transporter-like MFS transporter